MKNYYVTPRILRRVRLWSEVKTYMIGLLIIACAVLLYRAEVARMETRGAAVKVHKLRGNLAAVCRVSDVSPALVNLILENSD